MIGLVAHAGIPGWAPLVATTLFMIGVAAVCGAYWLSHSRRDRFGRAMVVGLGVVALGCFGIGTAVPLIVHATASVVRPGTTARLSILSPTQGEVIRGDPASVTVTLQLEGGRVVPFSSLHLVTNEGHIHLYMDGSLVSMTGTDSVIQAPPGMHHLQAEFVAIDHGPFHPRVVSSVDFVVQP